MISNQQHHLLSALGETSFLPCAFVTYILGKGREFQLTPYLESKKS